MKVIDLILGEIIANYDNMYKKILARRYQIADEDSSSILEVVIKDLDEVKAQLSNQAVEVINKLNKDTSVDDYLAIKAKLAFLGYKLEIVERVDLANYPDIELNVSPKSYAIFDNHKSGVIVSGISNLYPNFESISLPNLYLDFFILNKINIIGDEVELIANNELESFKLISETNAIANYDYSAFKRFLDSKSIQVFMVI